MEVKSYGAPVGDSVVKGLCRDEGTYPGLLAIRGNGYDGVLATKPGVTPPLIVWLDSVEALVDEEDGPDDTIGLVVFVTAAEAVAVASSRIGETLFGG
jgi:hypothetical protein